MKIYTKTGDQGETKLFGGTKISKANIQIEAYGTVDELNAQIGVLITVLTDGNIIDQLRFIQSRLFDMGAILAADESQQGNTPPFESAYTMKLEYQMDLWDTELPPLKHFVLCGANPTNAQAHVCRTVCRRAERRLVQFNEIQGVEPELIIYLNRLSDYFFVLSRWLCFEKGDEEIKWIPSPKNSKN